MARQTVTLRYDVPCDVVVNMETETVEAVYIHGEDTMGGGRALNIPGSVGEKEAIEIANDMPWPSPEWK